MSRVLQSFSSCTLESRDPRPTFRLLQLERGEANRAYGSTNMNENSSRSHTIYRLVIESRRTQQQSHNDPAVLIDGQPSFTKLTPPGGYVSARIWVAWHECSQTLFGNEGVAHADTLPPFPPHRRI